ncbi:MAG: glycoside hydrolase family 16 protein [Acidimicrobiales bacterium]|nr:glycoside hydrolase family 16 protein [Acidimicrobiales bacterium]
MPIGFRFVASLLALAAMSAGCRFDAGEDSSAPASLPFIAEASSDPLPDSPAISGEAAFITTTSDSSESTLPIPPTTSLPSSSLTIPEGASRNTQPFEIVTEPTRPQTPSTTRAPATSATSAAAVGPTTAAPPTTARSTTTTTTIRQTTAAAPPTTTTTAAPAGPVLVFAEEFDSFDSTRWTKEHSTYGDGNAELQCYTPQQVSVTNGNLVLRAETRTETCPNGSTRDVTSGMVRSKGVTFSPGQRIVYRVKLTPDDEENQGGLWPAFWSSGWAGGGWPSGGEWDGFEVMTARSPKRTVFSLHFADPFDQHKKTSKEVVSQTDFSANWHELSFDYGRDGAMIWRMDGVVVQTVNDADTKQGWPAPFNQAMTELKINLALGGSPGPLDSRALPATYQVDYVRIYDLPN